LEKSFSPYRYTNGFKDYALFRLHYLKHVINQNEFGSISEWEYARRADEIWGGVAVPANHGGQPNGLLEECTRAHDGARLRYDNNANELGILHGNTIGTFFRPIDGRAKFLRECVK
jgi:hypothetical protein